MNYLIKGTGRTGSNLLLHYLAACGYEPVELNALLYYSSKDQYPLITYYRTGKTEKLIGQDNLVIHDHSGWLPLNTLDYNLIISRRDNKLDQLCSHYLAINTKQYTPDEYTDEIKIEPFNVNVEQALRMKDLLIKADNLMQELLILPWLSGTVITLEDHLSKGPGFLHMLLGETPKKPFNMDREKNPHSAKDYIMNYDDLKKSYNYNCVTKNVCNDTIDFEIILQKFVDSFY